MRLRSFAIAVVVSAITLGAGAGGAAATTFCVPNFHAACPNNGTNVAEADLEKAMGLNGKDGIADQILIAAATLSESAAFEPAGGNGESFEPNGNDPLTITGAGTAATVLTTAGSANSYLVNLNFNNGRAITIRKLTVRVPASFPDGLGAAMQLDGDTLENVDVVSRNLGSAAIPSIIGPGNLIRNGELRGEMGGTIAGGIAASNSTSKVLVEGTRIVGATAALETKAGDAELTARRVEVRGARSYGALVYEGTLTVENSTMTIDNASGLYAYADDDDGLLFADHVTIVNTGNAFPALGAKKLTSGAGDVFLRVTNSIVRGFSSGYETEAPFGPGVGLASLKVSYSNLLASGDSSSGGSADFSTGNINADPLLLPDFSLPVASPSVDAGDPGVGLTTDFLGLTRPVDGNGDGIARRDQGAFEYQPPVKPGGGGGNGGGGGGTTNPPADATPPETTIAKGPGKNLARGKAKFSFSSSEAGSRFECKLDGRKVSACKSPKRYSGLKPGRHTFKVWATDGAGNKDPTPAKRRFTVPAVE